MLGFGVSLAGFIGFRTRLRKKSASESSQEGLSARESGCLCALLSTRAHIQTPTKFRPRD